jgi:hypothetical protein
MRELLVKFVEFIANFTPEQLIWLSREQPIAFFILFILSRITYFRLIQTQNRKNLHGLWWVMKILKYLTILAVVISIIILVVAFCLFTMPEFNYR